MIERTTNQVCSPDWKHRTPDGLAWLIGMWMKLLRTSFIRFWETPIRFVSWDLKTIYIPFARGWWPEVLATLPSSQKPPSIPISYHEVPVPILHSAWIRSHWGWSIWICQALKWAEHRQGQGDEESKEQNAIQVEDLWMSTHLSNLSTHLPQIIESLLTFGVDRHLLGKKNNCKVCILQTLGLWSQIFWDFLRFLVRKGKSSTSIISGTAVIPSDSIQWHLAAAQFCHSIGNHDDTSRYFDIGFWVIFLRNLWKIWDLQSRWERNGFVPPQLASMLQAQSQAPMGHAKSWPKNLMVGPLKPQETWCQKPKFSLTYTGTPLEMKRLKSWKAWKSIWWCFDLCSFVPPFSPIAPLYLVLFNTVLNPQGMNSWSI